MFPGSDFMSKYSFKHPMQAIIHLYPFTYVGGSIGKGDGFQPFFFVVDMKSTWGSTAPKTNSKYFQGMDSGHYLDITSDHSYSIDLFTIFEDGGVYAMAVPRDEQFELVSAEHLYIFKWNKGLENISNCGKKILTFKIGRYFDGFNLP